MLSTRHCGSCLLLLPLLLMLPAMISILLLSTSLELQPTRQLLYRSDESTPAVYESASAGYESAKLRRGANGLLLQPTSQLLYTWYELRDSSCFPRVHCYYLRVCVGRLQCCLLGTFKCTAAVRESTAAGYSHDLLGQHYCCRQPVYQSCPRF